MSHPLALCVARINPLSVRSTYHEEDGEIPSDPVESNIDTLEPIFWVKNVGVYQTGFREFTVWHHDIPGRPFKTDSHSLACLVAAEWAGIDVTES